MFQRRSVGKGIGCLQERVHAPNGRLYTGKTALGCQCSGRKSRVRKAEWILVAGAKREDRPRCGTVVEESGNNVAGWIGVRTVLVISERDKVVIHAKTAADYPVSVICRVPGHPNRGDHTLFIGPMNTLFAFLITPFATCWLKFNPALSRS